MPKDFNYRDLQAHLKLLDEAGLLVTVNEPVNKDTEMHPLVRWQFRGGISEPDRKAFLFTNITDSRGRTYDLPVVIGALAANRKIYSIGMGVELDEIGDAWSHAMANPIPPVEVPDGPCQEVVLTGADLEGEGKGLDALPIPISTPGFDSAPYFTATGVITRDPETGTQNMGTYRAGLKSPNRLAIRMSGRAGGAEGAIHWKKYHARGERMPIAIVMGCSPAVCYCAPQKLRIGLDEMAVAGAINGAPVNVVRGKTVDLLIPAEAELVIEGYVDPDYVEPEAPFGESHGHIALEDYNNIVEVTAITRKKDCVIPSIISQVTPSESSVIKRVAYEPLWLGHLRDHLGIKGVKRVSMHEPLTNIRRVVFVVFERGVPTTEIWRALYGAATLNASVGKYIIAVNEDIDPDNGDAVLWALAYRANPALDVQILPHRDKGHGPKSDKRGGREEASMLIDATLKADMPPVALPKKEYMEHAKDLWEKLGLPPLTPEVPWFGYSLGDWSDEWDAMAKRAAEGHYLENGRRSAQLRRNDVAPNTSIRDVIDNKRDA
ncbi:MAG: UbiD family decarboxylase [Alphaproteobacteria bacterium]|nr:UbiD family decarboxylase [Alphaproteobacteria bacterium]